MAEIKFNGSSYVGKSISIVNGVVTIDGKKIETSDKQINIEITGDVEKLSVDVCEKITVNGSVHSLSTISGDVDCGDVGGNVGTQSGEVDCNKIGGSVNTQSGDVTSSGDIGGDVETLSGDVKANSIAGRVNTLSGDIKGK